MKKRSFTIIIGLAFLLAGAILCCAQQGAGSPLKPDSSKAGAASPSTRGMTPALPLSDIQIEFKLDPRLTKSLYMGDRWVSPRTYTRVGEGKECIVEIKAYGFNARGQSVKISPQWISADPETVTVSPAQGNQVKLAMKRVGETSVEVVAQGLAKKLSIKVVARAGTFQADISQHPVARVARAGTTPSGEATTNGARHGS